MTSISAERIAAIEARRDELSALLGTADLAPERFVALSKEYAEIEPVAAAAAEVRRLRAESEVLAKLNGDDDPEIRQMAADEQRDIGERLPEAERALALKLLPRDAADERPAMLEIRAGTGGDEAALFAGDLFRMYQRFAEGQGWRVEPISASASEAGGYKEVVASVTGQGVFARLNFESGGPRGRAVPRHRKPGPHPHLRRHRRGAARARGGRCPHRRERFADRRVPFVRRGRAARQHHRFGGAHHAYSERHRRQPAGREIAAQEQDAGDEGAARSAS